MSLLLPGDDATSLLSGASPPLRLGGGLSVERESPACVSATRAGLLSSRAPSRFWLASGLRRYTAALGDSVVGVVVDRGPEAYRVTLRGAAAAALPQLAFDGASKRNKPALAAGALVFARVAAAPLHGDVELTCQAPSGGVGAARKDWTTGQTVYGELRGGTLVTVGLAHARRLLQPDCALLATFGESIPFEVAIGMNGLVWLRAASGEGARGARSSADARARGRAGGRAAAAIEQLKRAAAASSGLTLCPSSLLPPRLCSAPHDHHCQRAGAQRAPDGGGVRRLCAATDCVRHCVCSSCSRVKRALLGTQSRRSLTDLQAVNVFKQCLRDEAVVKVGREKQGGGGGTACRSAGGAPPPP